MATAFPFAAIVGQEEMKLAILAAAIDPTIGGVLVFGDRGTGKSTAVRALAALLPKMRVVVGCPYGCDPAAVAKVCDLCRGSKNAGAQKSALVPVPVVDLPLGATEDRVVGALDLERALTQGIKAFEPGLLARAHRGFLYIDEVNLLEDHLVDLLIDVAASGENVVEREGLSVRHPARFVLVGSGNPEEGELRPQLLDRFGLSVEVKTPDDLAQRIEVVRRRDAFERDPDRIRREVEEGRGAPAPSHPRGRERLASIECARCGARARSAALHAARHRRPARRAHAHSHGARGGELRGRRRGRRCASEARCRAGAAPSPAARSAGRGGLDAACRTRGRGSVSVVTAADAPAPVSDWEEAAAAAALFAVDPVGIGGVVVRSLPGPVRDRWLALVRDLLPSSSAVRRVPLHVTDNRLLGGLDLTATLRAGRPVAERGILVEADGGVVVLAMAERLSPSTAARFTAALDAGEVVLARDGIELRQPARLGVIALDEGMNAEECAPAALLDRLAFQLDLTAIRVADIDVAELPGRDAIAAARARIPETEASDAVLEALCATAAALGIASLRAPLLALRVARAAAALAGRSAVAQPDAVQAGRLVLAPRAVVLPPLEEPPREEPDEGDSPDTDPNAAERDDAQGVDRPLEDILLEATQAAIPAGLLDALRVAGSRLSRARSAGKAGALQHSGLRGRPAGVRRGEPRAGIRLNVVETLRAAAPWQRMRRREVSRTRGRGDSDRNPAGGFSRLALQAARGDYDHLRRRCLGLVGAAPTRGGEGCGGVVAGGLLRAPRSGRGTRASRARGGAPAAADPLARAREAQSREPAGGRRHPARRGHRRRRRAGGRRRSAGARRRLSCS